MFSERLGFSSASGFGSFIVQLEGTFTLGRGADGTRGRLLDHANVAVEFLGTPADC
jgi:hypothetical protein